MKMLMSAPTSLDFSYQKKITNKTINSCNFADIRVGWPRGTHVHWGGVGALEEVAVLAGGGDVRALPFREQRGRHFIAKHEKKRMQPEGGMC